MRTFLLLAASLLLVACAKPAPSKLPVRGGPAVTVEKEAPLADLLRRIFSQLDRRDPQGAQLALNRILIGHPEHLETRVLQAMVMTALGQTEEAAATWAAIERILIYQGKPTAFALQETLEEAALHYVRVDRPERSRLFLDELWRRFPTGEVTVRTQRRAAELEASARRWPQAIQRCRELIRIRPDHSAAARCQRLNTVARRMLELGPEPPAGAPPWRWENPLPQGNDLHDVWVAPGGAVIAVGDAGTILQRAPGQRGFVAVASPTRWPLRRLWGTPRGELWAVGAAGVVLRHAGKRWELARPADPEQGDLWGVFADDGGVYAVGDAGRLLRGGPSGWREEKLTGVSLRAIWGDGRGRLLAVGDGGTLLQRTAGTSWQGLASDCYEDLWSLWGTPETAGPAAADEKPRRTQGDGAAVFLVGNRRTVVQLRGERARESVVGRTSFRDVWGIGGAALWAVGKGGDVVRWSGGKWHNEASGTLLNLFGVAGQSADELWAVGEGGTILRRRGGRWSTISGGLHQNLVGATAAGGGYALGERGLLLRRRQGRWSAEPPLPPGRYRDLWGDGRRLVAVGDHGLLVVRSGGGPWRVLPTQVADDLNSVTGYPGGLVAVGSGGTILRLEGERLLRDDSSTGLDLRAVLALSPRQLVAVGNRGMILLFDGKRWKRQESGTLVDLLAVWGLPGGPLLVGGASGTLLERVGPRWRPQRTPLPQTLVDLWGASPRHIVAVSDRGGIMHFDGSGWQLQRSPATCLAAVQGDAKGAWAVGCRGAIVARPSMVAQGKRGRPNRAVAGAATR